MSTDIHLHPNVDDLVFYVVVRVRDKHRTTVEYLRWEFPFKIIIKWGWYFKYRAALLQIKYPRNEVIYSSGRYLKDIPDLEKNLKNKITATKRKISEMKNKLERARLKASETELFGIEDEPIVIDYKNKIQEKEKDLIELQNISIKDFYLKFKNRYDNFNFEELIKE